MAGIDGEKIKDAVLSKSLMLPDGRRVPRLGQGTWHMGELRSKREAELGAIRLGIQMGMTLIDTAEMYGGGAAEQLVGEAIRGFPRKDLFLVSKVYPHNAGRANIFKSCEASLRRMDVGSLDLYLLHWRGAVPLKETVECMEALKRDGLIKGWGVSNFDTEDMQALFKIPGGDRCQTNQVLYHLGSRGIEFDLLPWLQAQDISLMAYSPLAQAGRLKSGLAKDLSVLEVGRRHRASAEQVLLAFVMRIKNAIVIPKAGSAEHVRQNAASALLSLEDEDLKLLEQAFPAPGKKVALDIS